jgi:folate-binding protein YgfZ
MSDLFALVLDARGVLRVAGEDRQSFLQGIVSNDVAKAGPERALWSAFLTPQGKFLHEFFLAESGDAILLDCEAARLADLRRRLSIYKLRSKVTLEDASADLAVAVLFGPGALEALGLAETPGRAAPFAGGLAYVDPRLAALGARALLPRAEAAAALAAAGFAQGALADYDRLRISLGVPDGSRDLEVEKSILLENGFDELHGVDWNKGCYMGQELTARTKYRALIKKRLLPVEIDGPAPAPGTPITAGGK